MKNDFVETGGLKLPDELIETVRVVTDNENDAKMGTVLVVGEQWNKYKEAIVYNYADEKGLESLDEDGARGWFLRSLSGSLANTSYSTLANRMRVFRNVVERGLYEGNEIITAPVWVYLMRNLSQDNGLVGLDDLKKRIDWYYDEGMPTVRTIEEHVKKNGVHPEWEQYWKAIVRNALKLLKLDIPDTVKRIVKDIVYWRE